MVLLPTDTLYTGPNAALSSAPAPTKNDTTVVSAGVPIRGARKTTISCEPSAVGGSRSKPNVPSAAVARRCASCIWSEKCLVWGIYSPV